MRIVALSGLVLTVIVVALFARAAADVIEHESAKREQAEQINKQIDERVAILKARRKK